MEIRGDGTSMKGPKVEISLGKDTVHLSWPTQTGVGYTVEYARDLEGDEWNFLMFVAGDGSGVARTFPKGADTEFYRVTTDR